MKKLDGKTAIILGATGGIGFATSEVLAEAGANLVLASRKIATLQPIVNKLDKIGTGEKLAIQTDAAKILHVDNLFARTVKVFGQIDLVFVTTGTFREISATETQLTEAEKLYSEMEESILRPMFNVALVIQGLKQMPKPWLVHVSSHVVDNFGLTNNWGYGPLKAGGSDIVARLQAFGFKCTDIRSGFVDTLGNREILDTEEKRKAVVQKDAIGNWLVEHFFDEKPPKIQRFESQYKKN